MSRPDDKSLIALEDTDIRRSVDPDVVEFALVLSRTIDSMQQQPDEMRQALYELARYKLNEQLKSRNGKEFRTAHSTLETAIEKVERFYAVHGGVGASLHKLSSPSEHAERGGAPKNVTVAALPAARVQFDVPTSPESALKRPASMALRLAAVLGVMVTAAIAIQAFRSFGTKSAQKAEARIESPVAAATATTQQQQPTLLSDQGTRKPEHLLPSHFGAFAFAEGKLVELRLLRGVVPDSRVAISSAIREDSETVLPDGKLKFIVYRRDLPGSMPTRAEVRVIAKVKQYLASSAKGDSTTTRGDHWVIRNISFPYRIAPIQGAPDMFEVESEALDFSLAPGRYALVWKGVGYDFVVAGDASSKHCLEQIAAVNGVFYSECR
jgi:hypothetical protein